MTDEHEDERCPTTTSVYTGGNAPHRPITKMYLNYCRGDDTVDRYIIPGTFSARSIQKAVNAAVDTIMDNQIKPIGVNDGTSTWDQVSFFVVVLEGPDELCPGAGFEFTFMDGDDKRPNHTFFGGQDLAPYRGHTAAYCVNYFRDKNGKPLPPNMRERFQWETHHSGSRAMRFHNDSGDNIAPITAARNRSAQHGE